MTCPNLNHVLKCEAGFTICTYTIATTYPNLTIVLKCGSSGFTITGFVHN